MDTGARINVLKLSDLQEITHNAKINKQQVVTIRAYGGDTFKTLGTITLECTHNDRNYWIKFHVIDRSCTSLLGLQDSLKLNLLQLSEDVHQVTTEKEAPELEEYKELFNSSKIGMLPIKYKMKVDKSVTPVVRPPRKIPAAMKEAVTKELQRMEDLKIIQPVDEPTEWVSSMVAAKKKSSAVRICIDPRDLNMALQRPHHPMKTIEEVISDIPGAKIFSVLDAKSGFWQIPLDEDSVKYTTFNTPNGRYQFIRMPYGLNSGSEVFQRTMEQLFSGYPCDIIADDILISGTKLEENDKRLQRILQRCKEVNLQLNKEKCKFRVNEVSYVGHLLTDKGVIPDPNKIKAIQKMPPPENQTELQRILGMTNYLSKFIPNYSEVTSVVRSLLHKDSEWCWLKQHQDAFEKLKMAISSPPVLQYYDVKRPVTLTCDASKAGLGAACLQGDKPVAYASRAMTECEQRYAQIEKELLAVVFACKKFNHYIYGREITVETDHQPLITILRKPLNSAPTRLQKMMLQLQRYNINIVYKRGKELYIADTLSRAYLPETEDTKEDGYDVVEILPVSETRADRLRQITAQDPKCQEILQYILQGWPESGKQVSQHIKPFYAFRDELTLQDGLIMKGQRIVIPHSLQKEYLEVLHQGHPGIETSKNRAKETVFWSGMNDDIEKTVRSCEPCNRLMPKQQKEPMELHDIPELPFEMIGTDLFEWKSQVYMVIVDSYSGFYDIDKLPDMTSKTVQYNFG